MSVLPARLTLVASVVTVRQPHPALVQSGRYGTMLVSATAEVKAPSDAGRLSAARGLPCPCVGSGGADPLGGVGLTRRKCETCQHFSDAGFAKSGWCRHPARQVDALVMVRKNELGCNNGWKKDLWEPTSDGAEADVPGQDLSARPVTSTSAGQAAAALYATPLESDVDRPLRVGSAQEDVLVGQQPLYRKVERQRDVRLPQPDTGSAVQSRDPAEAIRKAHDAFRDETVRRARRPETPPPVADRSSSSTTLIRPATEANVPRSDVPTGDPVTRDQPDRHVDDVQRTIAAETVPEKEPAPQISREGTSAASPKATDCESHSDAMTPHQGNGERPSRWAVSPARRYEADDSANEPAAESINESAPGLSSMPTRPARVVEQPTALARHRWPPRANGEDGLFLERKLDESDVMSRSAPGDVIDDQLQNRESADDAVRSEAAVAERREWQQRWQSRSLLQQRATDGRQPAPQERHSLLESEEPINVDAAEDRADVDVASEAVDVGRTESSDLSHTEMREEEDVEVTELPHRNADHREPASGDHAIIDELVAGVSRSCFTCRDFRAAESGDRGWCTNRWAFSHRRMVDADECPCESTLGSWWLPREAIWLEPVDVQGHGLPTPLLDAYLSGGKPVRTVGRRS